MDRDTFVLVVAGQATYGFDYNYYYNWAKAKKHIRVDNFPVHLLFLHEESLGQSAMVINYPEETWGDKSVISVNMLELCVSPNGGH